MEEENAFLTRHDTESDPEPYSGDRDRDDLHLCSEFDYDHEKAEEHNRHHLIQLWQYRAIAIGLATILLVFGLGSAISAIFSPRMPSSSSMGECGRTPEQARQNGCVFDLMMSGWVHPPCYDKELSDRFLRENNFSFFWDLEGKNQLTEAEARLGNYKIIYTNGIFHYQHCTYIWSKQVRARRNSPYILDSQSRSVEHVEHCFHRVGSPNITQIQLQTGTKLHSSTWRLDCITGEREVHTAH
ncbi:hypothetical protein JX266_004340 [Neoarthrinium moseri]|nr:hypothetical protein JX266_004340 [Neoarthrinium moseri]